VEMSTWISKKSFSDNGFAFVGVDVVKEKGNYHIARCFMGKDGRILLDIGRLATLPEIRKKKLEQLNK
jgi:hypothetical protein